MKNSFLYTIILMFCSFTISCGQENANQKEILAKINDYELSYDHFSYQIAAELEMDSEFKLTKEAKQQFLERIIRKELLIQEAKRLELDRKDNFIKAIERYWESTLIRDLIDLKGKEIIAKTFVSEEEINQRYEEMKHSNANLQPLEKAREMIRRDLLETKKSKMLKDWIDNLRKNAKIEIDSELLHKN